MVSTPRMILDVFVTENYPPGHPAHTYNVGIERWLTDHIAVYYRPEITDFLLATLVRERKAEGVSAATVNRTVTEYLSRAYSYYERTRGVTLSKPNWKNHRLKEPRQRERFITDAEYEKLKNGADPDYMRVVDFALLTGLRLSNLLPTWDQVDVSASTVRVTIKGGDVMDFDLPVAAIRLMLAATSPFLKWHDFPNAKYLWVFNYRNAIGDAYPITRNGFRSWWQRRIKETGLTNLHIHDLRHSAATALLEATGDITLVQRQLGHRDIKTTMRYAHAKRSKLVRGLNDTAAANPWGKP